MDSIQGFQQSDFLGEQEPMGGTNSAQLHAILSTALGASYDEPKIRKSYKSGGKRKDDSIAIVGLVDRKKLIDLVTKASARINGSQE